MEYTYCITIGDWSNDGHNQSQKFLFKSNMEAKYIREGYIKSVEKTKISFHNTGYGSQRRNDAVLFSLFHEYDDNQMPYDALKILLDLGCPKDFFQDEIEEGEPVSMCPEGLAELILWFIKLSLPRFEYELIQMPESINGFWDKDLNVSWGYGLYFM